MSRVRYKMRPSEAGDARGLELGREQGEAFGRALRHIENEADTGQEIEGRDYLIGLAAEKAESMCVPDNGGLQWQEPQDENVHIEISVRDRADGRLIRISILQEDGTEIGTHPHPFLWHPYLYHYGRNWRIPHAGRYQLRLHFEAPDFARRDRANGSRIAQGVDVSFHDVILQTGKG